jgi:hypothetical protein
LERRRRLGRRDVARRRRADRQKQKTDAVARNGRQNNAEQGQLNGALTARCHIYHAF